MLSATLGFRPLSVRSGHSFRDLLFVFVSAPWPRFWFSTSLWLSYVDFVVDVCNWGAAWVAILTPFGSPQAPLGGPRAPNLIKTNGFSTV